jgi:hypothetical protein
MLPRFACALALDAVLAASCVLAPRAVCAAPRAAGFPESDLALLGPNERKKMNFSTAS